MKSVWAWGLASVGLLIGLGVYLAPLQPSIVALQFTFTPGAFQAVLEAWGAQGVQRFRMHLPVDDVLLLCYGAFGFLLTRRTAWFGAFSPAAQHRVATLMPLAALCDAIENLLQGYLSGLQIPAAAPWYAVAGGVATVKWLLLLLFVLCAAWAVRRKPAP